jgi:long-subunit fatty acid transport protein
MKKIFLIIFFAFNLFSQEGFFGSYPSNTGGGEGAILNPSSMVEFEGFQIFSYLNLSYEKTNFGNFGSKEEKSFKGVLSGSYNITEDIAVGGGIFPLFFQNSNFKKNSPFRFNLRKFEYNAEEMRASFGVRVLNNLNVGFSLRQIGLDLSFSKSELSPPIYGENYEVYGSYKGSKKGISYEISSLYKFKDIKFAFIFRPELKLTYGYNDFSVNFEPEENISEDTYKTLKTYYPSGGVKTEGLIPPEIIISGTKPIKDFEVSLCLIYTDWSSWNKLNFDYKNETVDPSTGEEVLKDQEISLNFKDSFKLKGLISYIFPNKLKGYFEILLKEKITENPSFPGLEMGNGVEFTLGASYPLKFKQFNGDVFGYYTFSIYEKNNDFDYKKNNLGAGLSFSF